MDDFNQWSIKLTPAIQTKTNGRLAGKTFSIKELFNYHLYPATGSTNAMLPKLSNCPLIDQLLNEGAILTGKTHTHEIALGPTGWNPIAGQALNPYDKTRISGGSSSGSAITVATKECDFSLGTDTGGSIRIPAAFCGIYGFKPTSGRIITQGILPLSPTLDHVGILSNELNLLIEVFELLSTKNNEKQTSLKTQKIGLWDVENWVEPVVWEKIQQFVKKLEAININIEKFIYPMDPQCYANIVLYEAAKVHEESLKKQTPAFSEVTYKLLQKGMEIDNTTYQNSLSQRLEYQKKLPLLFEKFDYLIAPTVPCVAPKLDISSLNLGEEVVPLRQALLRLTNPWSMLGLPSLNIPIQLDDLFIGAQLIGDANTDIELLEFAKKIS